MEMPLIFTVGGILLSYVELYSKQDYKSMIIFIEKYAYCVL